MRVVSCLTLAAVGVLAAPAGAQTRGGFELGAKVTDYSYREKLEGETVAKDDGAMYGLTVGYTETLGGKWFIRGNAEAVTGSIDYKDDQGERIENVSQTASKAELHVGRDFAAGAVTITPFIGLGHRTLRDESGGEQTAEGSEGYDRRVTYLYVPVGLGSSFSLGGNTRVLITGQANIVSGGRAKSNFSDIDPEFPDLNLKLRGGLGITLSALFEIPVGGNAIRFGPILEHWNIKRSRSQTFSEDGESIEFFEPRNRTTMLGAVLMFAF